MATISAPYGFGKVSEHQKNGDSELIKIVSNVQIYLKNYNHRRFFLTVTVKYYKRCSKSWAKVSIHLQKFLNDPRKNYSVLMFILEGEIDKFPYHSYYRKQLLDLFNLLQSGPVFSQIL